MDEQGVLKLLQEDEGINLEFKETFNENVMKTISAFANTQGGVILIGINRKKRIAGITITDNSYQDIVNKIVNKTGIMPDIDRIKINDNSILVIEVSKSYIPISFDGRYYKRVGNTTREMSSEELKRFFQRDLRWERLREKDFKIDEIDEDSVRDLLRIAKIKGRLSIFNGDEPIEEVFEKLGLMEDGKINNAGIILFAKNPQKYFDYARVRIVRLKDSTTAQN